MNLDSNDDERELRELLEARLEATRALAYWRAVGAPEASDRANEFATLVEHLNMELEPLLKRREDR